MAIEALGKATSEEPTLEEAHVSLMRLHALSGSPGRALAQYERLCDALQKDIGSRPTEATHRLRDEIAAGRLRPTSPAGPPQVEEISNRATTTCPRPGPASWVASNRCSRSRGRSP
jgi:DNA-binding SARP family transcriptional activator